jgi:hypothetical protein
MITNRKTTRPMIGNPSVEYMAGYFAWARGKHEAENPYRCEDAVSAKRWTRGWNYAEAHRG